MAKNAPSAPSDLGGQRKPKQSNSGLAFDSFGSGPPLILLHGLGSYRGAWSPLIPRLAPHRQVIAVDLPGGGCSAPLPSGVPYTVDTLADAITAFIRELRVERAQVVGNSLGGAIALELARREVAGSVTAISPIGFWSSIEQTYGTQVLRCLRRLSKLLQPVAPRLLHSRSGRSLLFALAVGRPWRFAPVDAAAAYAAFLNASAFDVTLPRLRGYRFRNGHELKLSTTIIWGRRDLLLPIWQMRRARRLLPQARFVVLPGCGHVPMSDDPEQLVAELMAQRSDNLGPR
jgi:pimeloyl-ACP methyl ester carboxylesterase